MSYCLRGCTWCRGQPKARIITEELAVVTIPILGPPARCTFNLLLDAVSMSAAAGLERQEGKPEVPAECQTFFGGAPVFSYK